MERIDHKELLKAGVHFGHLKRKWNPKMLQYIFMEKKGIHLIDLNKTSDKLLEAAAAMKSITESGRKIMFVATKKQAKETVKAIAQDVNMPYVTERWLGGMLTNFGTIRKSIKKMQTIEKILADTNATGLTKKERLMMTRQRAKLSTVLGGIEQLNRLPAAIFVVDINHEHIAIKEAKKLGIRTFGMVDTNSNPNLVDFAIPANDDASKSIEIITNYLAAAVKEGLTDRQNQKDKEEDAAKKEEVKTEEPATEAVKTEEEAADKK
ncbi:MAG: small subunit ribosomal protein S2 [Chitinophagales bacterium]|jgi:small subunit ribosomal protein S2